MTTPAQHEKAIVNGELMAATDATVPAFDDGFLRGDAVFDAFRVYQGSPFGVEEHLDRLRRSAEGMMIHDIDFSAIAQEIPRLIEARGSDDDYGIRVVCTRGGNRILMTESVKIFPPLISLASIEYRPNIILDGLKTLSYGGNVLANRIAQERGHDEALLVTPEGYVLEGPTASLFWSPDGETLVTPPLDGILASITRGVLLDALEVVERPTTLDELLSAHEAFLCSSVREVQPVGQIDDHRMPVPGPLTAKAETALAEAVKARVAAGAAKTA